MSNSIKRYLAFFLAIALVISIFPVQTYAASKSVSVKISGEENYTYAYQVLELMNKERKAAGLSELTMDKRLLKVAMKRAAECQVLIVSTHTRPNNSQFYTVYPSASKGFTALGENIAIGQASPQAVMNSWMNSAGHRANILAEQYNVVGVGCYKIGNYYAWVQSFGTVSKVSKAKSSSYSDGKQAYTIKAKTSNLNISVSVERESDEAKTTAKAVVYLATSGFEYNRYALPASQFKYSSSNKKVATVDSSGNITAKSAGTTKITVKYKSTGKKVAKAVTITIN